LIRPPQLAHANLIVPAPCNAVAARGRDAALFDSVGAAGLSGTRNFVPHCGHFAFRPTADAGTLIFT